MHGHRPDALRLDRGLSRPTSLDLLLRVVSIWHGRARTRRALRRLTIRELADIGRTIGEQDAECGKWFWQA